MDEDAFLRTIQSDLKADIALLVYADWLEERGDAVSVAKAKFLRLMVASDPQPTKNRRKKRRQRLQQLAATLDTGWLAIVSRLPVELCHGNRKEGQSQADVAVNDSPFQFQCDRHWQDLRPSDDAAVRFCDVCQQEVHYCDTIMEARFHAVVSHCVAIDLGIIRRERDLEPPQIVMGFASPDFMKEEEDRLLPDPVSAERERRKLEKETN